MSKPFFRIEMLPAKYGDALWIEYGTEALTRRILIDAFRNVPKIARRQKKL